MPKAKAKQKPKPLTQIVRINREYTLTSEAAQQDELDIVVNFIKGICLSTEEITKFADIFHVKVATKDMDESTE